MGIKKISLLVISAPFMAIIFGFCYLVAAIGKGMDEWAKILPKTEKE